MQSAPAVLNEISMEEERRTETGMGELDREMCIRDRSMRVCLRAVQK